jgi:hypothetical protein
MSVLHGCMLNGKCNMFETENYENDGAKNDDI